MATEVETYSGIGSPRRSRGLKIVLAVLITACVVAGALFITYIARPAALPDLIPLPVRVFTAPHYRYSITHVSKPVGVAVSPDGQRVYVAESGGQRAIKVLDGKGRLLGAFTIPFTSVGERAPVYVAVDRTGRVFVSDRIQAAIYVYDANGRFVDEILSPTQTLSGYVASRAGALPAGTVYMYNAVTRVVDYRVPGGKTQTLPAPTGGWNPLGVRFDKSGDLWVTDLMPKAHLVHMIPAAALGSLGVMSASAFKPTVTTFGAMGTGRGQFMFPNAAVTDSAGRVYVADGNNGRISIWSRNGRFTSEFGRGAAGMSLGLPRGIWIDGKDRLYTVDAVSQNLKVFDVHGKQPKYLATLGGYGIGVGEFNYPNDITVDASGRVYIADRENDRVQVWAN